jgi:hypothetical protein
VTFAEAWNGTSWRIQSTRNPLSGASRGALNGVSCTSATACTAVGSYTNTSGTQTALAEGWDGTSWRIQPTPDPGGAGSSALNGVSCASPTACIAVGSYTTSPGNVQALAEAWDGTSWTIQDTPNLAPQDRGTWLDAVSCSSGTACTAVGGWSAYHVSGFVADFWDGTTWTIQSTPSSTFPGGELNGVSCTSATACTAVGELSSAVGLPAPVADTWDGTSWTLQNTPTPGYTHFNAVSCTSATVCTAVGSYFIERES